MDRTASIVLVYKTELLLKFLVRTRWTEPFLSSLSLSRSHYAPTEASSYIPNIPNPSNPKSQFLLWTLNPKRPRYCQASIMIILLQQNNYCFALYQILRTQNPNFSLWFLFFLIPNIPFEETEDSRFGFFLAPWIPRRTWSSWKSCKP